MRATGNGAPDVCANNLLLMVRGEVPFDRVRGLDPRLIDCPISSVMSDLEEDAKWVIDTYEPRAEFLGITVAPADSAEGTPTITANLAETEE